MLPNFYVLILQGHHHMRQSHSGKAGHNLKQLPHGFQCLLPNIHVLALQGIDHMRQGLSCKAGRGLQQLSDGF